MSTRRWIVAARRGSGQGAARVGHPRPGTGTAHARMMIRRGKVTPIRVDDPWGVYPPRVGGGAEGAGVVVAPIHRRTRRKGYLVRRCAIAPADLISLSPITKKEGVSLRENRRRPDPYKQEIQGSGIGHSLMDHSHDTRGEW